MKVIVVVCDEQCQSVNCFCLAGRFGYSYQLSHGTLARPSLSLHSLFGFSPSSPRRAKRSWFANFKMENKDEVGRWSCLGS